MDDIQLDRKWRTLNAPPIPTGTAHANRRRVHRTCHELIYNLMERRFSGVAPRVKWRAEQGQCDTEQLCGVADSLTSSTPLRRPARPHDAQHGGEHIRHSAFSSSTRRRNETTVRTSSRHLITFVILRRIFFILCFTSSTIHTAPTGCQCCSAWHEWLKDGPRCLLAGR